MSSCNICYNENINIYKCKNCSCEMCGVCYDKVKKYNDKCPACRRNLIFIDKDCPKLNLASNNGGNFEKINIIDDNYGFYMTSMYDKHLDEHTLKIQQNIVHENVEYTLGARSYEITGVFNPRLKHLRLIYQGNTMTEKKTKMDDYYVKCQLHPMIVIEENRESTNSVTINKKIHETNNTFECVKCGRTYKGVVTIRKHISSKH